jgi:hypothetical protein
MTTPHEQESAERARWAFSRDPQADADPYSAWAVAGGARVSRGTRVRLRPRRRADSMDLFLDGRAARVEAVFHDVDDATYVAVTLEDDPASDLHGSQGRFLYFYPEEIEPLASNVVEEPPDH